MGEVSVGPQDRRGDDGSPAGRGRRGIGRGAVGADGEAPVDAGAALRFWRSETLVDRVQRQDRSGRWRFGWLVAGVWLVYLTDPLTAALKDPNRWRGLAGAVCVLVFAVMYVTLWSAARAMRNRGMPITIRSRVVVLGSSTVLTALALALIGERALAMTPFLLVQMMTMLPTLPAVLAAALLVVAVTLSTRLIPGWRLQDGLSVTLALVALVMWGVVQMVERNVYLTRERERLAELAVANERTRFARDLHDLLGHSLTLLAIKAELAGRLVKIDADRAEAEIAEVERLARDALVDVRAAVGGYRLATLAGELVSARAVLAAAGIRAELPSAVDEVPGDRRELLGWAVREGVTNVVRHSGASRCWIVADADGVQIMDDGHGPRAPDHPVAGPVRAGPGRTEAVTVGHGLAGLRERAEAVGAHVTVGRAEGGGFLLRVGW